MEEENEKIKFDVEKIIEEPSKKGSKLLKIFIRSSGKQFIHVVKREDYLDENGRLGLHRLFIKAIKEERKEDAKSTGSQKKDAKALEDIVGTVFEDEED